MASSTAASTVSAVAVMDPKHPSATERIAEFVAGAQFEDLPEAVVEKAKQQMVFFLSRALEGHEAYEAKQASRVVTPATAGPGATVIGEPVRLNPADAAFSNCARMRGAGGRDDVTWPAGIHTGVITLPTALAIAETVHASGRELLLALALGYEVPNKLGRVADPWNSRNPRRPTNVYGAFAPITVAGRLMCLDAEALARAYGYAVNLGIGVAESGMMDHYYALLNRSGILAAQLAAVGGGPYDRYTIEGPAGLYCSFFGAVPRTLENQIASLGRYWEILDAEQKIYPGTGQHAPSLHQIFEIARTNKLDPTHIRTIVVVEPGTGDSTIRKHEVSNQGPFVRSVQAYSSLPYAIAVALIDGRVDLSRFPDEDDLTRINDPEVAALMRKVFLKFETGHGPRYSRTELTMYDGQLIRRTDEHFTVDLPRTDWAASLAKFGHGLLSDSQLHAVETMLGDLEHLEDTATLLQALRPVEAAVP